MRRAFLCLLMLVLANCSTGQKTADTAPLIPLPTPYADPPDYVLEASVRNFLNATKAPAASQYEFIRADLDNDGRRDALVLFKNPYGYWCGLHGCTMLVLKAGNDDFTLVNAIQPVREPLYISEQQTNGWKNLVARVSGRMEKAKNVVMTFDGKQYPQTPANLPPDTKVALNTHQRIFNR